uniref:Putative secreted protein n=1 Tax=Anopheles darlingi TaxID=43151 RepID=A0A2M4DR15_ANODA
MSSAPSVSGSSLLLLDWTLADRRYTKSMRATVNIRKIAFNEEGRFDERRTTELRRIDELQEVVSVTDQNA